MRLAVDARPLTWQATGGIHRICKNLLLELGRRPDIEVIAFTNGRAPAVEGVETIAITGGTLSYVTLRLPAAVRAHRADALLGLAPELVRPVVPSVLLLYDVYPLFYRRWLPPASRRSLIYARQVLAAQVRLRALRSLRGAAAISEHTARDVRAAVPGLPFEIHLAPPGVDPDVASWTRNTARSHVRGLGIQGEFLLYVGAINQQKNVNVLLKAFRLLRQDGHADLRLVIAGSHTWPRTPFVVDDLGDAVRVLNDASDDDIGALYASCAIFVLPSFYEGFGMPALEAMAAGAPVLVADSASLPEVVGEAGIVFDPRDPEALAWLLGGVLADPDRRRHMAAQSRLRASSFGWERMADGVLRAIEGAVRG